MKIGKCKNENWQIFSDAPAFLFIGECADSSGVRSNLKPRFRYLIGVLALGLVLVGVGYFSSQWWLSLTYGFLAIALSDFFFEAVRPRILKGGILKGGTGPYAKAFTSFPAVVILASTIGWKVADIAYNLIWSSLNYYPPIGYGSLAPFGGNWHIGNRYFNFSLGWLVPTLVIAFAVSALVYADLCIIQDKKSEALSPNTAH